MRREWRRYLRRGVATMAVGGVGVAAYSMYNILQLRNIAERSYRAHAQVKAADSSAPGPRLEKFPPRSAQIKRLSEEEFDVLVVGGGATGTGVALEAQTRGEWF